MRQEVAEYFDKKKIPVDKMVNVGLRRGLSRSSIKRAAEEIYDDIKMYRMWGAEIDPIRLAWRVFARAKTVAVEQKIEEDHRVEDLKAIVNDLTKTIESLKESMVPWYVKLWRKYDNQANPK